MPGRQERAIRAEQISADADVATCVDRWRRVASWVGTIAASIPEDAADSPASSEYLLRHRRARTRVHLIQRPPSLSLRALEATSENFSCRVLPESGLSPEVNPLFSN